MISKIIYKERIKTRNLNRIDAFTSELNRIWKTYFVILDLDSLCQISLVGLFIQRKRIFSFKKKQKCLHI